MKKKLFFKCSLIKLHSFLKFRMAQCLTVWIDELFTTVAIKAYTMSSLVVCNHYKDASKYPTNSGTLHQLVEMFVTHHWQALSPLAVWRGI